MAPQSAGTADVAILEGTGGPETGAVNIAIDLLSSGRASCMVVVLHHVREKKKKFGIDDDYQVLVERRLKLSGLTAKQYMILVTPDVHPVTLNEATIVLQTLSNKGVKSAFLLTTGFHTRRSLLVYRHVGEPLSINILPLAYFNDFEIDSWWRREDGISEFTLELLKLLYYQVRGYIPAQLN